MTWGRRKTRVQERKVFQRAGSDELCQTWCYARRGLEIDHGQAEVTGDFVRLSLRRRVIRIDCCLKPVAHVLAVICLSHHPEWQ